MGRTFDELMAEARAKNPPRKPRTEPEHDLQVACVKWFGLQYPKLRGRLFADRFREMMHIVNFGDDESFRERSPAYEKV